MAIACPLAATPSPDVTTTLAMTSGPGYEFYTTEVSGKSQDAGFASSSESFFAMGTHSKTGAIRYGAG